MSGLSDERLVAYLDGELDAPERHCVAAVIESDAALRERAAALTESAAMLRAALDEVLREDVPESLLSAAHGKGAAVDDKSPDFGRRELALWARSWRGRRYWRGAAVAASFLCLAIGAGGGYFAATAPALTGQEAATGGAPASSWLDNLAGYHKLLINAGANEAGLVDVPANTNADGGRKIVQKLPADFRPPNLKPWGLDFIGARYLINEGRPATQLFYTTDNQKLGPITIVVASSAKPDLAPAYDRRDDINFIYWRHHGHAYALVGTANEGYLWNIAKDIAWQFDAI